MQDIFNDGLRVALTSHVLRILYATSRLWLACVGATCSENAGHVPTIDLHNDDGDHERKHVATSHIPTSMSARIRHYAPHISHRSNSRRKTHRPLPPVRLPLPKHLLAHQTITSSTPTQPAS